MRFKNLSGIIVFILIYVLGCAGTSPQPSGSFKRHSEDEQKVIIQKIKDNMADYDIIDCRVLYVFDPKNDDKTIEVAAPRCRPFVQQTQNNFVEIFEESGIRSILGPDGQDFGFITWAMQRVYVNAEPVDPKTIRISLSRKPGGGPGR